MSHVPRPIDTAPSLSPERDPALLASLLARSNVAPPMAPASPMRPVAPSSVERPARITKMSWQDVPFYAAAFAFGLVGWVIGGYFTLLALASLGLPVQAAIGWPWEIGGEALLSWLIPLGVSALEVGFARRARGWPLVVFILVAGIDFISTVIGVHVAYADQQVFGVQLAAWGAPLLTGAFVSATLLTFGPEKVILGSLKALRDLTR